MSNDAIFAPMLALMSLTLLVWVYMYARRLSFLYRSRIDVEKLQTPGAGMKQIPDDVNYPAHNFRNLCELPPVFYAICLYLYAIGSVDAIYLALAWWFVGFRVLHSVVHSTFNRVSLRFKLYMLSSLALWIMLAKAVFEAILG